MTIFTKLFNVKSAWIKLQRDTEAFNYNYATLDQIQSKIWDVLEKEKLIIVHFIKDNKVITEIRDIEWESFVSSEIEMTLTKAQDKWSEITYYRRYNLLSLLDLEVEDDDWKKAQDSTPKQQHTEDDTKEWFNNPQLKKLQESLDKFQNADKAIKTAKSKYKVSKVMENNIRKLFN